MSKHHETLEKIVYNSLSGRGAHIDVRKALEGLDWETAGREPKNTPFTIFQLLNHMIYWQDYCVGWFKGKEPSPPKHAAEGWPEDAAPQDESEWQATVQRFESGLGRLEALLSEKGYFSALDEKTYLEVAHTIGTHNSYHTGQIVLLRRMLGAWPPPGGGFTW
jgi:uncharacterized damage-inducible protein DinB